MLDLLSKHVQNIIIKVVLGLITLVFVFWGFGGYNQRSSVLVATVNGVDITLAEHDKTARIMLRNFTRQLERLGIDSATKDAMLVKYNFRKKALNELVKDILIKQAAKKLNVSVNDQEVANAIQTFPEFQQSGAFNLSQYLEVLKNSGISATEFEEGRRDILIKKKIQDIVSDSVQTSEAEVLNEYKRQNEKVSVNFLKFNPVDYESKVKVTENELKTYFDNNNKYFEIPEKKKVEILAFDNQDYAEQEKANVTDAEITAYYDANSEDYIQKEQVDLSHILFSHTVGDDPQQAEDVKKKAEGVIAKLEKGDDFAKLAKEYSQDKKTKDNGGNIGVVTVGTGILAEPSVKSVVAGMKPGDNYNLVESTQGYHIIKVNGKFAEKVKELETVKENVILMVALEKGKESISKASKKARGDIFKDENMSLSDYAAKNGLAVITPPPLAFGDEIPGIGESNKLHQEILELPAGGVSFPIDISRGRYIVKVIEVIPANIPEFDKVKAEVAINYKKSKSAELAEAAANKALKEVQGGAKLVDVAKKLKLKIQPTKGKKDAKEGKAPKSFTRINPTIPGIGVSEEIAGAAFGLSTENPYPNKVYNINNYFYLIKFSGKEEIDMNDYKKEKAVIAKNLRNDKASEVFAAYIEDLIEKADIQQMIEM